MGDPTFVSLGKNDRLAKLLARVMPEARIISADCLDALGPLVEDSNLRILVDPRFVRSWCVKHGAAPSRATWERRQGPTVQRYSEQMSESA